jgi:hypothetical protein
MIKVILADKRPIENHVYWSYPFEELDHIFENAEDGDVYLYYDGRLYEAPYLDIDGRNCFVLEKNNKMDEEYIPSSTNGDYSPGNPWDAPGMSPSDFI